jgi:hypothetical protein
MTRLQAFAIHLSLSLLLIGLVLGLLIWVWYPGPLFELERGWQVLGLLAMPVLVLGPALTLLLFKPGKPGLRFDLGVVALLQIGALAFGMWQLHQARPALLVYAANHFKPLPSIVLAHWDSSGGLQQQWAGFTPQWLQVELPDDPVAYADLVAAYHKQARSLHSLGERYRPLQAAWPQMLQDAVDIEAYVSLDPDWAAALTDFTGRVGRPSEELAFFPYVGRDRRLFLAFDRAAPQVVGVLDIPFEPMLVRSEVPRLERVGLSGAADR